MRDPSRTASWTPRPDSRRGSSQVQGDTLGRGPDAEGVGPAAQPDDTHGGPGARPLVTDLTALLAEHGGATYREVLRVPALSLGLFAAGQGHDDSQTPHQQDEVYVVLAGAAVLEVSGERTPVGAGSIAYVPALVPHRFVEITEDLRVVVLFAPPLTTE